MGLSLSTLFGTIFGVGIVAIGVLSATKDWNIFISLPSAFIVIGGTLTSSFIGFRWRYIYSALKDIGKVFLHQKISPRSLVKDVGMVIGWAKRVQQEGPGVFEQIGNESKEDFIQFISSLISTGYTSEEIHQFAETSIEENYFRHLSEATILNNMASAAPAFGMVGTLIGLIVMLGNMDDPSQMGPGLSIALMTTLYGVLAARFVFQPCSTKTRQLLGIQRFREYLILEGIMLILNKRSTFYIQDRLNSFLDRKTQYSSDSAGA